MLKYGGVLVVYQDLVWLGVKPNKKSVITGDLLLVVVILMITFKFVFQSFWSTLTSLLLFFYKL
jgi:hypothetical protein